MLGQTIAILFVLMLLAATLWLLRRRGLATVNTVLAKRSKQKFMQVVERVPLTANHSLHLVKVGDRVILIGVSPSGCRGIDSFAAPLSPVPFGEGQ
jgi:flagellar biosynthetic protein FliO